MINYIFVRSVTTGGGGGGTGPFTRLITIDHTKCGSSSSSNFPVLFSWTDATLKTVANGGHVLRSDGYDIVFALDPGDIAGTLLNWEMEYYDPTTGTVIAWVKVNVSAFADTEFYINYGDSAYTTFQGGYVGSVWDSNYYAVYHLGDGSTLSDSDSTSYGQTLTNTSVTATTGKIYGGGDYNGSAYQSNGSGAATPTINAQRTFSIWFKMTSNTACDIAGYGNNSFGFSNYYFKYDGFSLGICRGDATRSFSWSYDTDWHHLAVQMGDAEALDGNRLYLDGVLQSAGGGSGLGVLTALGGSNYIVLGGSPPGSGSFIGALDEVRIGFLDLGADWITTEYNNINSPSTFYSIGSEF